MSPSRQNNYSLGPTEENTKEEFQVSIFFHIPLRATAWVPLKLFTRCLRYVFWWCWALWNLTTDFYNRVIRSFMQSWNVNTHQVHQKSCRPDIANWQFISSNIIHFLILILNLLRDITFKSVTFLAQSVISARDRHMSMAAISHSGVTVSP